MVIYSIIVSVFFAVSFAANAFLIFKLKSSQKEPTFDARMLLADLLRGNALVRVTRVAPEDVFLRSPRSVQ